MNRGKIRDIELENLELSVGLGFFGQRREALDLAGGGNYAIAALEQEFRENAAESR